MREWHAESDEDAFRYGQETPGNGASPHTSGPRSGTRPHTWSLSLGASLCSSVAGRDRGMPRTWSDPAENAP